VTEQAAALKALMAEGLEDVEPTCPREALRNAPELATVLNFLHTFRSHLQLMGFTAVRSVRAMERFAATHSLSPVKLWARKARLLTYLRLTN
jgi:hypothetical protein